MEDFWSSVMECPLIHIGRADVKHMLPVHNGSRQGEIGRKGTTPEVKAFIGNPENMLNTEVLAISASNATCEEDFALVRKLLINGQVM